jgi:hypothetical protein
VELRQIIDSTDLLNEEIRHRSEPGSKTAVTKHFVAFEELRSQLWTSFLIRSYLWSCTSSSSPKSSGAMVSAHEF